ncbi:biliverdin-producing heme oxygenase [Corynebacterium xerosis]|uniref:Biliverdin-producing heme oxygenase n=1 Tax=Corynebacterium xerosis TaxID=1725 RepID=A0A2N6SZB3_9CORY|nr:biliverdin-producing heme oxygenase [Corynebacterium xerosis]PMC62404.1 biliverdin-producing heme oxygenase [Corynebacterium xerosis]
MLQTTTERLTTRLREATAAAHDDAENSGFMSTLLDGELHACAAADLAGQLWFVYGALEDAVRSIADTPEGAAIADERLERHDALERDLEFLVGPQWRSSIEALPPTAAYVNRLTELARARDAASLLAHHYVRYLGDLSGGQIIARRLRDHYGIDGEGAAFYDFSALGKIKPYRDAYRERLDALELRDDVRDRVLAEAVLAFRLNTALFRELDGRHAAAGDEAAGAGAGGRAGGAAGAAGASSAGEQFCPHLG